jgi:hypothetical protein
MSTAPAQTVQQTFPYPQELADAVEELRYLEGWDFTLVDEDRGQGCSGLTFNVYPNKPDSYHPDQHVNTRFLYPVPAAAFNRESWEEWLWERIEETEKHERAEWFRFGENERRPYKPAHADGWNPGVVRSVVSETVTNTPNAGRLVRVPCIACGHHHKGRMGEHFTISHLYACSEDGCECRTS